MKTKHPFTLDLLVFRIRARIKRARILIKNAQLSDPKYLERWANLYKLALSIPPDNRFNMNRWAVRNRSSECGTSACLAGHAALHPWFRKRGLKPLGFDRTFCSLNHPSVGTFDDHEWFGLTRGWSFPFYPGFVSGVYDGSTRGYSITPEEAAYVVLGWMHLFWRAEEVEAAIERATATYDAEEVHKRVPWGCPA